MKETIRYGTTNGYQWVFRFDNGYGASVIKKLGSYGYDNDLFELCTIHFTDSVDFYELCHIMDEIPSPMGFLTNEQVMQCLQKIKDYKGE